MTFHLEVKDFENVFPSLEHLHPFIAVYWLKDEKEKKEEEKKEEE